MHISPPIETVRFDVAPQFEPAPISGAESPYGIALDEDDGAIQGESFAEILAELLRKTGMEAADEAEAPGFSLADIEGADGIAPEAGQRKALHPGVAVAADTEQAAPMASKKTEKMGDTGTAGEKDASELELTGEEQDVLLAAERLLNAAAMRVSPEEESWLAGDGADDLAVGEFLPEGIMDIRGWEQTEAPGALSALPAEEAALFAPAELAVETPDSEKEMAETAGTEKKAPRFADNAAAVAAAEPVEAPDSNFAAPERAGAQAAVVAAVGEKEGRGRLDEARGRDKKRGAAVEVRDFRTAVAAETAVKGEEARVGGAVHAQGDAREVSLELRLSGQGQNAPNSEAVRDNFSDRAGQAFENLLARELHQNFNNDIVRHASMILRDNNQGIIRLALKPETLGNVKIRLEMAENKITGHIIVESEEALRAFEREIVSLEQAFKDSGFEGASLEMSLASDQRSGDGGGAEQNRQWAEASRFMPEDLAASRYDAVLERAEGPALIVDMYQRGQASINMLV